jgi:hypothetical protein
MLSSNRFFIHANIFLWQITHLIERKGVYIKSIQKEMFEDLSIISRVKTVLSDLVARKTPSRTCILCGLIKLNSSITLHRMINPKRPILYVHNTCLEFLKPEYIDNLRGDIIDDLEKGFFDLYYRIDNVNMIDEVMEDISVKELMEMTYRKQLEFATYLEIQAQKAKTLAKKAREQLLTRARDIRKIAFTKRDDVLTKTATSSSRHIPLGFKTLGCGDEKCGIVPVPSRCLNDWPKKTWEHTILVLPHSSETIKEIIPLGLLEALEQVDPREELCVYKVTLCELESYELQEIRHIDSGTHRFPSSRGFVTENHGTTLNKIFMNHYERGVQFPERKLYSIYLQISRTIKFLASQFIFQNDADSTNIVLDVDRYHYSRPRLIDWGYALWIEGVGTDEEIVRYVSKDFSLEAMVEKCEKYFSCIGRNHLPKYEPPRVKSKTQSMTRSRSRSRSRSTSRSREKQNYDVLYVKNNWRILALVAIIWAANRISMYNPENSGYDISEIIFLSKDIDTVIEIFEKLTGGEPLQSVIESISLFC